MHFNTLLFYLNYHQSSKFYCFLSRSNSSSFKEEKPLLTLYTKEQCQLCDELVYELETNFPNEYQLEKVDITKKENLKYLRLYRNDIPVLFLNHQFLCMHKLNATLLRRKLNEIKNEEE